MIGTLVKTIPRGNAAPHNGNKCGGDTQNRGNPCASRIGCLVLAESVMLIAKDYILMAKGKGTDTDTDTQTYTAGNIKN